MGELKKNSIKHEKLLYAILKTTKEEFEEVIRLRESYYYSFQKKKKDKRGNVVYQNGIPKIRTINATKGRLNEFQEIVAREILSIIPLPPNVKGSVRGSSNIANAAAHLGKHYKFKTDMKSYFPSISYQRVYKMFLDNGFSSRVSTLLTHLTTNNYQLPQGTPTSSAIANLVFVPNDLKINDYCKQNKITHTRYVDDLVFSSQADFRDKVLDLIKFILDDGFKVSIKKTVYKAGTLEITGILTKQNILKPPDEYKELISDPTIDKKKTEARKRYVDNVKAFNRRKRK